MTHGDWRNEQGIESIFKKIGCEQSSLSSGMMTSTAVTESNIMLYLGIIEHRTNQLLQRYQVSLSLCRAVRALSPDKQAALPRAS